MPKNRVDARSRASEFKCESFYVADNKILMCRYCNVRLEFERKDTLKKHVVSERHKDLKAKDIQAQATRKRQLSVQETYDNCKKAKDAKKDFVLDTTRAFLAAGISVEKLDDVNIKQWFAKYVKGSGDLPTADWIRKKYIPIVGEITVNEVKAEVAGKPISILCDETTDKSGNCVFNVLFRLMEPACEQKVLLAASHVLDAANASTCTQAVIATLGKYEVEYNNCVSFVTDSARYMTASYNALHVIIGEHLVHTQCWAHKVNLVGHIWQTELDELNTVVSKVKSAFLNTRKRKHQYLQFLREKYGNQSTKIKLFPMPVLTRWNAWFESVIYIDEYIDDILQFLETLGEENAGVKFLKALSPHNLLVVKIQACFVADNSRKMIDIINFLEGNSYPNATTLLTKLEDLCSTFELLRQGVFPERLRANLNRLNLLKRGEVEGELKRVAVQGTTKLKNLIATDPSKKELLAIKKLFNPRYVVKSSIEEKTIKLIFMDLPCLTVFNISLDTFIEGYCVFKRIVSEDMENPDIINIDICKLLCSIKSDFPEFVKFSLACVWFTTSNVDAKRSFSRYSLVVSDRRRSLKPENADILTMVAFN